MKYFYLNPTEVDKGNNYPVVLKLSEKALKLAGKMKKLAKEHAKTERELIELMAILNNLSTDDISEIMCNYDFMVDETQYGIGAELQSTGIERAQYIRLKKEMDKIECI